MSPRIETWLVVDTANGMAERRRGRPDRLFDPNFTSKVTRPTDTNVGCSKSEASLANYAGTFTNVQAGESIKDLLITGRAAIREPNVTMRDCIVDVIPPDVPPTDSTVVHGITSWTDRSTVTIDRVTIRCRPENQSFRAGAGIHGSGITARRVLVEGMIDGAIAHGTNKRSFFYLYDSLIRDLANYEYDGHSSHPDHPPGTPSFPGSHWDGTHPDGVQVQGNLTAVEIIGNEIQSGQTAAVLITHDAGNYDAAPLVDWNWFPSVAGEVVGAVLNVKTSDPAIPGLSMRYNRINALGAGVKAKILMSPAQLAVAQITSHGEARNVWLPEPGVTIPDTTVPVYRGSGISPSNLYTYGSAA